MKRFRFLIIFGIIAALVFVSLNANIAEIKTIYITEVSQNNGYIEISGKFNNFYHLFKGYKYKTEEDKLYISVYSSFGFIGNKNISVKIKDNGNYSKVYLSDGNDKRVIHSIK